MFPLESTCRAKIWGVLPEADIKDRDKWLHPTLSVYKFDTKYGQRIIYLLVIFIIFVCFITMSFLTYTGYFHLHLLYQSYLGLCQATCVQSPQRQPRSAVSIAACEVQVLAADSQTVPTVATGVSKPLRCRLTITFTLTSQNLSLYTFLLLYWSLYNYAAHAADILTPTTVVQGVANHSRGL